ncbi:pyridine nucleotide-disulfide oxidoreductase [Mycolicibacterium anyangense]|uniref:Pyridine nucleotide-disulfide oxidoreductase n=1 Tax=Mycolicibacterium anyangense TaxID=1431246 RepID=A0A6N4W1B6_9MYCO|nr:FAD/NAD(P)-binding oxidoreductase [Mycolicibacterium anyangense]BBZ74759.1 pyridine nucleotide-disulfide oxidoreductase [Mycolicibacterium anyangense]
MESAGHVAVVGGSLAGLRTAEQLRAHGHTGPITVFGAERHFPYNRPPLSKEALAEGNWPSAGDLAGALAFRRRATVSDVDFRLGTSIVAADLTAQRLFDRNARSADYDGLVIATGLRPRRLSVPGPDGGRHVLRTVEDCVQLRAALAGPRRVVVVGGGFIGCEVAATLRVLGHHVTVVDPAGPPMQRVLGPELAEAVRRHHCAAGIEFVIGAGVAALCGAETVSGVVLDTGQTLAADVVVEAIGSHCNVEWLAGQGLDLSDGALADNHLAVCGAGNVVAVGDVARFPNPLFDDVARRVEHWSIPADTAKRAAATLLEAQCDKPFAPIPSFWSNQLDLRLQGFGAPGLGDEVCIEEGRLEDLTAGVVATYHRGSRHVGTVAVCLSPARHHQLRDAFAVADLNA